MCWLGEREREEGVCTCRCRWGGFLLNERLLLSGGRSLLAYVSFVASCRLLAWARWADGGTDTTPALITDDPSTPPKPTHLVLSSITDPPFSLPSFLPSFLPAFLPSFHPPKPTHPVPAYGRQHEGRVARAAHADAEGGAVLQQALEQLADGCGGK